MPSRDELESLFIANLPAAEKILSALARRHVLTLDAAEDFGSWAKLRLIENDYAILAKFRGESSLPTYLTVVLAMLFREYRVAQWGRWRPSAAARRSGDFAVRLETLVLRDGVPLSQAGNALRTSGETMLSDRDLAELVAHFPRRTPLRPVEVRDLPVEPPSDQQSDDIVAAEERANEAAAAQEALEEALATLDREDQVIVRLHYMEAMSVADIARGLSLPQKPLYRRLVRLLSQLRALLLRAGVSREYIREITNGPE